MDDDSELLRRYATTRDEAAFAELVTRRLAFVYHAALRRVNGDAMLAEEVAQSVFVSLARNACSSRARDRSWQCSQYGPIGMLSPTLPLQRLVRPQRSPLWTPSTHGLARAVSHPDELADWKGTI